MLSGFMVNAWVVACIVAVVAGAVGFFVVLRGSAFVADASATIGPNVVLGRGCSIGAAAVVRDSVLWDRVRVGAGATLDEAIIASGVTIGAQARISKGSVVGHDVAVEPGAVLEPGARLGTPPERIPG